MKLAQWFRLLAILLTVTYFSLNVTSCSSSSYSKEITYLDSISEKLKNHYDLIDVDNDVIQKRLEVYQYYSDTLQSYYSEDQRDIWLNHMGDVNFCAVNLQRYLTEEKGIKSDLEFAIDQIEDLKHDLQNDLIPKDKVESYVLQEASSANASFQKSEKRSGRMVHCIENYDAIIENADSILTVFISKY